MLLRNVNVGPVTAMGGAITGSNNLFENQFNILVDPESAVSVFEMAQNRQVDLTLVPTECSKQTPYQLDYHQFAKKMRVWSPHVLELYGAASGHV